MIARISGKVTEKGSSHLLLEVNGIYYKVLVPITVMQRINKDISEGSEVNLITYHYLQVEPSKSTPVLIGFLNEVEKEFFEAFITVSGIGPRAALKALNKPISAVARAIDEGDVVFLQSLPGIGQQRAREIVAKLQNKVGKFGLIQDDKLKEKQPAARDMEEEAMSVLMQLEYKKSEAREMIKKALENRSSIATTEELLNQVYKQRKSR